MPFGSDRPARSAHQFTGGDLLDLQHVGDPVVGVVECLTQDEGRPLGRAHLLQDDEHRDLERRGPLGAERRVGAGVHRLGQPRADIGFAAHPCGPGRVDRQTSGHGDQERRRILHRRAARIRLPLHPHVLDDVLGVGDGAEHAVGDAEQSRPEAREVVESPVETRARGRTRHMLDPAPPASVYRATGIMHRLESGIGACEGSRTPPLPREAVAVWRRWSCGEPAAATRTHLPR